MVWPSVCAALSAWLAAAVPALSADDVAPLDPLQQAVVDSLEIPRRTAPADLLAAAIRAADVEAVDAAAAAFRRLDATLADAGDALPDLLADLGDGCDTASLLRLERLLASREPRVGEVMRAIRDAASTRRRDPARLAAAAAGLAAGTDRERRAAVESLARAGVDALPALVDVIGRPDDPRARGLALELVRDLGPAARGPLVAWLASDDVDRWPAVIDALAATAPLADDADYLLAPAAVADVPPSARDRARAALGLREPLAAAAAAARVAARLDRTLSRAALPEPDHLLLEPITDPAGAAAAFGGSVTGSVERWLWNQQATRPVRTNLSPRAARALEALHLARDLAALGAQDPAAVRLVLLARLEYLLVTAGEPTGAVARLGRPALEKALSPPTGFSVETAAEMLDMAVERGMWEAAVAVAATLEPADAAREPALAVNARKALVRALAVPDPAVQFAAARALALAAGPPPWPGSSRMVEVLAHAATATGDDVAVVAHPDVEVCQTLAAGVSQHGYRAIPVATGRAAILAARGTADTRLVILAARLAHPTALETTEFLRNQGVGGETPVLVVVDPLDDDGRGRYLQRTILAFRDSTCVGVVDGLDSFFSAARDPATGGVVRPPRFADALALVAGPAAVDPATRGAARAARLAGSRAALALLAHLGRRGHDVSAAVDTARLAVLDPARATAAAPLLSTIGRPAAQRALAAAAVRAEVEPGMRELALASFAVSLERHGLLLGRGELQTLLVNYTDDPDAAVRKASGAIIDVIEAPRRTAAPPPLDAAPSRPR